MAAVLALAFADSGAPPGEYDADAIAYFERFSVDPGSTFKDAANTFVLALKAAGVWAKLDHIGMFATPLQADRLLDVRDAAAVFSVGGTTTFTASRGIAGDGATGYIGFPEALGATGNQYARSSASFGVYCNLQGPTGTQVPHLGGTSSARTNCLANSAGSETARINQSANSTNVRNPSTTRTGHRTGSRIDDNNTRYFYNGTFASAFVITDADPDTFIATLGRNGSAYCDDRFAACWSGAALTDTEQADMDTALHAFMTALGAQYA
ncbi:hypothetical protein [Phenylobacterium koreense]|uniref:Uncharacterized protein n=1 Tax=Phenylobacterium koreense TaxID=266125 RepID=A0ABV2EJP8_9CAUL